MQTTSDRSCEWNMSEESNESGRSNCAHFFKIACFANAHGSCPLESEQDSYPFPFVCPFKSLLFLVCRLLDGSTAPERWLLELDLQWDLTCAWPSFWFFAHPKPKKAETCKGPEKEYASWELFLTRRLSFGGLIAGIGCRSTKNLVSSIILGRSFFKLFLLTPWGLIRDSWKRKVLLINLCPNTQTC